MVLNVQLNQKGEGADARHRTHRRSPELGPQAGDVLRVRSGLTRCIATAKSSTSSFPFFFFFHGLRKYKSSPGPL